MSPGTPGPPTPRARRSRRTRAAGRPRTSTARRSRTDGATSAARPGRSRATAKAPEPADTPRSGRLAGGRAAGRGVRGTTPARRRSARAPRRDDPRRGRRRATRAGDGVGGERQRRVLVAGIGNVFRTDDGFGCEVVRRLAAGTVAGRRPGGRLRHPRTAPRLRPARPWDALVIVDALPDRGAVGSVVGRRGRTGRRRRRARRSTRTAWTRPPCSASLAALGGTLPPRTLVVGCQVGRHRRRDGAHAGRRGGRRRGRRARCATW